MIIQYLQSCSAGLLISLMGSIPLGNLNLAAMRIATEHTYSKALAFATGVVIVELLYLSITLSLLSHYTLSSTGLFIFRIISVIFLLIMATTSFIAATKSRQAKTVFNSNMNTFVLGIIMSAVNPIQIPFWAGWAVYLMTRMVLVSSFISYATFVIGAGIGTFIALLLFIFTGRKLSALMLTRQKLVNILFGSVFMLLAVFQCVKLL